MKNSINRSSHHPHFPIRHTAGFLVLCLLALLLFSNLPTPVIAAAGDLDLTFANFGRVSTDFPPPPKPITALGGAGLLANAIVFNHGYNSRDFVTISGAEQPEFNGTFSIVVTGPHTFDYILTTPATSIQALGDLYARRAGPLDTANAIAVQPDGKIIVAGRTAFQPEGPFDLSLARYNANGSLDGDFGTAGQLTMDFGGSERAAAVAVQPDGRIIVGGPGIVRLNADGTLDASFGTNGRAVVTFTVRALAVQPDGRMIVAGALANNFVLERYNTNGSIDVSFGALGRITTDFGGADSAGAIAVQPDGKIIAAGSTTQSATDFALARYNPNGSPDTTFNLTGMVRTAFNTLGAVRALSIQSDGKIVAAGLGSEAVTGRGGFGLVRYENNGNLDTSFGVSGRQLTVPSGTFGGEANAVTSLANGKLVAAGYFTFSGIQRFSLVGYNPDGTLDTGFGQNGDGRVGADFGGSSRANAMAIQPDGFIVAAGSRDILNFATRVGDTDFALARFAGLGPQTVCVVTAPPDVSVNNDSGQGGAVVNYPAPAGSAACSGPIACSPASGSFFPVGTTTVACTESSGASDSFTVTVADNESPAITSCPTDGALTIDNNCIAHVPDLRSEVTAIDNFTPSSRVTIQQSPAPGTPVTISGYTNIQFTVTDEANNSATCSARVADRTPPTITGITLRRVIAPTESCQGVIPDLTHDVLATDCNSFFIRQSPAAHTLVNAGTTTPVTVILRDVAGNETTATVNVDVLPDADCDGIEDSVDRNRTTGTDESQIFSSDFREENFIAPATGPTFGTILDRDGWNVGINAYGSGVQASVNGSGGYAAIQACDKPYEVVLGRSGQRALVMCDVQTVISNTSGPSLVTRMMVRALATPAGSSIHVRQPATPSQPGWGILLSASSSMHTVYLGSPVTADPQNDGPVTIQFMNYASDVIGSLELAPGQTVDLRQGVRGGLSITNLGTAPLTFTLDGLTHTLNPGETFTDSCAGVAANLPPTIFRPADRTVNTDPGSSSARVQNLASPPATDRCGAPLTPVGVRSDGRSSTEAYPLGSTSITWTATDQIGNQASVTQTIVVLDREPPMVRCPGPITVEFTGEAGASVTFLATATDNAPGAIVLSSTPASGSAFPIGTTTVTVNAGDQNGNASTCSFVITVLGPRGVLQNVRQELTALRRSVANKQVAEKLDLVINDLTEALDASVWFDQTRLQSRPASLRVFLKAREAAAKLRWLIEYNRNPIPADVLQGLINRIVRATRQLAVVAINDAVSVSGNQTAIAKARERLGEGDRDVAGGRYRDGIEDYAEAWTWAQLSIARIR